MITPARVVTAASAAVLSAVLVVAATAPAAASCAPPGSVHDAVAQADVVVVGTVTATRSHDRIATIAVDEVWKGDVGATIEVFGGPDQDDMATSVDRSYEIGVRYLIVALQPGAPGAGGTSGGRLEDNACSATQPWTDDLSRLRPSGARMLTPATSTSTSRPVPPAPADRADGGPTWIAAVPAGMLAVGTSWFVIRRTRRRAAGARMTRAD